MKAQQNISILPCRFEKETDFALPIREAQSGPGNADGAPRSSQRLNRIFVTIGQYGEVLRKDCTQGEAVQGSIHGYTECRLCRTGLPFVLSPTAGTHGLRVEGMQGQSGRDHLLRGRVHAQAPVPDLPEPEPRAPLQNRDFAMADIK